MTSSTDGLYSEATEAKRAARLAAYLEEYGAEEDETRVLLRYVSWFGTGACLLCGIALALPWHPLFAFVLGMSCWTAPREPFLRKLKAAEDRRRLRGLD
ncbi:hypothetical protein [Gluconobacter japonicus]|jgi:hypothetical protein|uniref:hypothetical protein n=1 Tax=Gluconobacter japonicus TaxID=376620 RepID=UPI001B8D4298|nr:hypothetical protein [Gluconobacter japonicus]MBS1051897.1 hypothetical protein [Gluconobacter japonicus]